MPMYAAKPTTSSTIMKLIRVMARCVRFLSSPPVYGVLRSRNPVADPRRVEIVLAQAGDAVAVQPAQEGLAPDVLFGQVSPEPAVIASITIAAHEEIVPGRNLHRALLHLFDAPQPGDLQDLWLVPGDLHGHPAGPGPGPIFGRVGDV